MPAILAASFGGEFILGRAWSDGDQSPPKGAGKLVPRENCRKVSKNILTLFDDSFFALREKCRKVSKIFLTLFVDF